MAERGYIDYNSACHPLVRLYFHTGVYKSKITFCLDEFTFMSSFPGVILSEQAGGRQHNTAVHLLLNIEFHI